MNKKEKKLVNELIDEVYSAGRFFGEKNILEHFRDCAIDGLADGFSATKNTGVIKMCNGDIEMVSKAREKNLSKGKDISRELGL